MGQECSRSRKNKNLNGYYEVRMAPEFRNGSQENIFKGIVINVPAQAPPNKAIGVEIVQRRGKLKNQQCMLLLPVCQWVCKYVSH